MKVPVVRGPCLLCKHLAFSRSLHGRIMGAVALTSKSQTHSTRSLGVLHVLLCVSAHSSNRNSSVVAQC
ncbi:hypothetical protein SORBI_3004G217000 [Sorghum bicolor]|nr:hypothetical protein SORBI_3004G217000 [Sorghum bicolor]